MGLTLRLVKGSPITYVEMDNNLLYLESLASGVTGSLNSNFIPLKGTILGSPLNGPIRYESTSSGGTVLVSTGSSYYIGIGNNIDLANKTGGSHLYFENDEYCELKTIGSASQKYTLLAVGDHGIDISSYDSASGYHVGMVFQDAFYTGINGTDPLWQGAIYLTDPQSNFVSMSLVHQQYVDGKINSSVSGSYLPLAGGTLTGLIKVKPTSSNPSVLSSITQSYYIGAGSNYDLTIADSSSFLFFPIDGGVGIWQTYNGSNVVSLKQIPAGLSSWVVDDGNNNKVSFIISTKLAQIKGATNIITSIVSGSISGQLNLSLSSSLLTSVSSSISSSLKIKHTSSFIGSNTSSYAGLQYEGDYSSNYTTRSLVDYGFVSSSYAPKFSGSYIPLSGTFSNSPLIGNVEIKGTVNSTIFSTTSTASIFYLAGAGDNLDLTLGTFGTRICLLPSNTNPTTRLQSYASGFENTYFDVGAGYITITSLGLDYFAGMKYAQDYFNLAGVFGPRSIIDMGTCDTRYVFSNTTSSIKLTSTSASFTSSLNISPSSSVFNLVSSSISSSITFNSNNAGILNISSSTQGFLPPRMTTAQRQTITSSFGTGSCYGLIVDDITINGLMRFDGTNWVQL